MNAQYTRKADGTTTDHGLNLQWSKTLCDSCITHHDAAKRIDALNEGLAADEPRWRFPTIQELLTLVRYERTEPATDVEAFPDTKSDWYWSGTLYANNSDYAWLVSFFNGNSYDFHRYYYDAFVRAVRELPASQSL
ncbi:MAG: DUF1566 domain-containing protein [Proteobacteria bacterium]|nr:DUF1566 domain-containing protein [Pseudomonadota bacterium]